LPVGEDNLSPVAVSFQIKVDADEWRLSEKLHKTLRLMRLGANFAAL